MAIDFQHLRRFTGDDEALLSEVFGLFTEQTSLWMKALDPHCDDEAWVAVSHALKGSARTLGVERLGALCDRAEGMVGESATPEARAAIAERIEIAVEAITDAIARWEYGRQRRAMKANKIAG